MRCSRTGSIRRLRRCRRGASETCERRSARRARGERRGLMREIAIGDLRYRLIAERRDAQWIAYAEPRGTSGRFGMECAGATEDEAIDKLSRWLEWQTEHSAALDA